MNYLIIKTIIDSTIANFKCKDCNSGISEGNINVLGLAGNSINLEVTCPNCRSNGVIKAEIGFLNQIGQAESQGNFKQQLIQPIDPSDAINDSDILSIRENLKNCNSIEDLFN